MMTKDAAPPRNISGIRESDFLWRVFPHARALQLFRDRANVLVAPSKWEDPFENFLSRVPIVMADGTYGVFGKQVTGGFVGQCWTNAAAETDATWRIYAPAETRGVRIKVQAAALFDTIYDSSKPESATRCFLAPIDYKPQSEIHPWLQQLADDGPSGLFRTDGAGVASTLLVKRDEFVHEKEVRLLFDTGGIGEGVRPFTCDPNELVLHVLLDPRWTRTEASTVESELRTAGYVGPIDYSELYQIPIFPPIKL
jgi:hypothetical protein